MELKQFRLIGLYQSILKSVDFTYSLKNFYFYLIKTTNGSFPIRKFILRVWLKDFEISFTYKYNILYKNKTPTLNSLVWGNSKTHTNIIGWIPMNDNSDRILEFKNKMSKVNMLKHQFYTLELSMGALRKYRIWILFSIYTSILIDFLFKITES